MVIWITGLSGAGKTTIGRRLYGLVKPVLSNTVLVDGDEIRELFRHEGPGAYSVEGRRANADRIISLCSWLDAQEINVICCVLSIFQDQRDANRHRFSKYYEVFIHAEVAELKHRDYKGLYKSVEQGLMTNVVGVDIPFVQPKGPNLVIRSANPPVDAELAAREIAVLSGILE